jgi:hypothetical protein
LGLIFLKIFTHTVPASFGKGAKCAKKNKKLGGLCGFAREKAQLLARASYPELT